MKSRNKKQIQIHGILAKRRHNHARFYRRTFTRYNALPEGWNLLSSIISRPIQTPHVIRVVKGKVVNIAKSRGTSTLHRRRSVFIAMFFFGNLDNPKFPKTTLQVEGVDDVDAMLLFLEIRKSGQP